MNLRRVVMFSLLIVLAVPLTGTLRIGFVEAVLWAALIAGWVVTFFVLWRPHHQPAELSA